MPESPTYCTVMVWLANTGSLPYFCMSLRNPANDESCRIAAEDELVVCIPYKARFRQSIVKLQRTWERLPGVEMENETSYAVIAHLLAASLA